MSTMNIRSPIRAGSFYEGSTASCRKHAEQLVDSVELSDDIPDVLYGGLVPHAGWAFSGALAARTLVALHRSRPLTQVVLLGADHTGSVRMGEIYGSGIWRTPLGEVPVDEDIANTILRCEGQFRDNPAAHANEHSLEVQVPLLQTICPAVRIVPIAIPPTEEAVAMGECIGAVLADFPEATVIGSTDLTHHGGHFGNFGGSGMEGVRWSRQNDQRMLELIERLDADAIVPEACQRQNACGAGAIAATIAACRRLGARSARVLEYTNSFDVVRRLHGESGDDTTVGYASVVFI